MIVDRPNECGRKERSSSGGGGGGGDDLGGFLEGDAKASEIRSIPVGASKSYVRRKLGPPSDDQEFSGGGAGLDDSCWYYDDEDFNSWQLCFSDGKVTSRNKY